MPASAIIQQLTNSFIMCIGVQDIPLKRLSPEELAPVDEASVYDQRVEEIPLPEDDDDF